MRMVGNFSFPAGNSCKGLDGFWHVIKQFRLLPLKDPAMMDKAGPLTSAFLLLACLSSCVWGGLWVF